MVRGIDNIIQNIPYIQFEWYNIPHNIVSLMYHCYGSK